jgi:tartrate-resistant acid phosphatase type 5
MCLKVPCREKTRTTPLRSLFVLLLLAVLAAPAALAQNGVSLFVIGDWGTGGKPARRVGEAMAGQHAVQRADAIISTGDNIYNSGVKSVDDPQWISKFENIYPTDRLDIPFWAVLGNHDHRGNADAQVEYGGRTLADGSITRWRMPARNWSTVFRSEGGDVAVRVVGIDTQELIAGATARKLRLAWIDSVLAAATEEWVLCVGHHPVYSHGHYGNTRVLVEQLAPLMEKHGVTAWLNGHEHDLQLLRRINGVRYIISGAGSGTRKTGTGVNTEFASRSLGFFRLDFDRQRMRIRVFGSDGSLLHEAEDARK